MRIRSFAAALAALALPVSAHAHHAMGNATPSSLFEGLVSGLAHPVIGLDHLLFVLAVGVVCYFFARGLGTMLGFVGGTLAGTVLHLYKATLPFPDVWVALTLVAVGVLLFRGAALLRSNAAVLLFAVFGMAHGYAYGEAIVGAEATPLAAYLAGFAIVQLAIALAAYATARRLDRTKPGFATRNAVGAAVSVAGVAFLAFAFV